MLRCRWTGRQHGRILKYAVPVRTGRVTMKAKGTQSCPTLCHPMVYTVHGVLQARILEWVAFSFSRGSSQLRIESRFPALQVASLLAEPQGKAFHFHFYIKQITNTKEQITLGLVKCCLKCCRSDTADLIVCVLFNTYLYNKCLLCTCSVIGMWNNFHIDHFCK